MTRTNLFSGVWLCPMVLPETNVAVAQFFQALRLEAFRRAVALDGEMIIALDIVSQQKYRY